jgi:rRNA maturation protein Nop10
MKIKKCQKCKVYTLEEECKICRGKTKQAGYKFKIFLK